MLLNLFISIEVIAVIVLLASFIKVSSEAVRNYTLAFLACILFFFLAYASFNLQTENCANLISNSTFVNDNITRYGYSYSCIINKYVDRNLVYLNMVLAIISLLYGLGMIFVRKGWN